jgi:hypothetical protein
VSDNPRETAILSHISIVGFCLETRIRLIYVEVTPDNFAKSRWLIPRDSISIRRFRANVLLA